MRTFRLGEVCEKIGSGATPRGGSDVYISNGIALIRSQNIYNDHFERDGLAFISQDHADELSHVEVKSGDVLLNITGDSVARVFQVPEDVLPARVNQHVAIIRPRADILDARYLRYYLASPFMQAYMLALAAAGATRNALTKGMIESFEIPAPPILKQRAIAQILGALDDKIEVNRRMNATLEAMASALFNEWFADREEAKGCGVGKLSDIATISGEAITPTNFPDEAFNHYSIPAFDEGRFPQQQMGAQIKSNKFVVQDNCVLISKLNPETKRIWLPFSLDGRSICSTEFLVLVPNAQISREYLFGLVGSQLFQDRFVSMVTGTSGSHQRVKAEYVLDVEIAIPAKESIAAFTDVAKPMLEKYRQNILESRTLSALRDTLLPKLMRGEVRVKDAEQLL